MINQAENRKRVFLFNQLKFEIKILQQQTTMGKNKKKVSNRKPRLTAKVKEWLNDSIQKGERKKLEFWFDRVDAS